MIDLPSSSVDGPLTPADMKEVMREHIRNLKLVQLPGTFHKVQLMYPAACAQALLNFAAQYDGIACHEA